MNPQTRPCRHLWTLLLGTAVIGSTVACSAEPPPPILKDPAMTANDRPTRSSSRMRAPEVPAIEHEGVRYEQLRAPSAEGLSPGGYVTATEIASGKRLWITRVYEITIDPNREADVQMVFFRSMAISNDGNQLEITDERSRGYSIELKDGKVQTHP